MDYRSAVSQTLAYSAYFDFPLSPEEVHFWLITSQQVPFRAIRPFLPPYRRSSIKKRLTLQKHTLAKEKIALKMIKQARFFPTIRLLALTGSVAAGNSRHDDDIDLMIITSPHTLWFTRPFFLFLLSLQYSRRHPHDHRHGVKNSFCPNLWLDASSLSLPPSKRNLYTAHEVLQIKPLLDRGDTYQQFLSANRWTKRFLANAFQKLSVRSYHRHRSSVFSLLLPLNFLFYLLQSLYMLPKKTTESVSLHSAFFHKQTLSPQISRFLQAHSQDLLPTKIKAQTPF